MKKILIIQTAFIGDVILATALAEEMNRVMPGSQIDFLVRKGNEKICQNNPFIHNILIWDKTSKKYKNLLNLMKEIRIARYDIIINVQRFLLTGLLTAFSNAKYTTGFSKNPLSFLFTKSFPHQIDPFIEMHEVERNFRLISDFTGNIAGMPKIYPSENDFDIVRKYKNTKYICIAPASVWFTKQFPVEKWIEFLRLVDQEFQIYLIGSNEDRLCCESIKSFVKEKNIEILAGEINLLQSAALMKDAAMNYVNDSAPLHLASAVNARVCSIYCSTIPGFGFGPLSDESKIIEIREKLDCRPCGLHGRKSCPQKHFKCALNIDVNEMIKVLHE